MAWIEQVAESEATGKLGKIYESAKGRAGGVANIIKLMSVRPDPLSTFMRFYQQLMFADSNLSRSEREMIATVTSSSNDCFY